MGIVAKQGIKNSFIMYGGAVIGAVNSILIYPSIMPEEQYGLVFLITSIAMLIASLAGMGATSTLVKYIPIYKKGSSSSTSGLTTFLMLISIILAVFLVIILIVNKPFFISYYANGSELFVTYFWVLIPLFIIQMFIDHLSYYANTLFKSTFQLFLKQILTRVGQFILLVMYYYNAIDFHLFMMGYIALFFIHLILLLLYLLSVKQFKLESIHLLKTKEKIEILKFGSATFFASIANTISYKIDIFMLGALIVVGGDPNIGLKSIAIYGVALNMASMLELPFRGVIQIVNPAIGSAWKDNNINKIKDLYTNTSEVMIVISVFVFFGIMVCMDDIVSILPAQYKAVKFVFIFLAIGKFFNVAAGANASVLVNSKRYGVYIYFTVFALGMSILTNYWLIPIYKVEGAAIATGLTYFLFNFSIWLYVFIYFKLQPFRWQNILPLISGGLLYILIYKIDLSNIYLNILIKGTLITVLYGYLTIKLNFSKQITDAYLKTALKYRKNRS